MKILYTIEEIHKIIPTHGSSPLLVTCDDFNDWVCKYDRDPRNLFNELLAVKFAKTWELKTPDHAFIEVKKNHIPPNKFPRLEHHLFDKLCFGSKHIKNSKEIDSSTVSLFKESPFRRRLKNKDDFLKIALFDIWLCNEDRNHNNSNILLVSEEESNAFYFLYAIDHVEIFNSSHLNYGLSNLTEEDSILYSDFSTLLFRNKTKTNQIVDNLIEMFYLCVEECKNEFDEIVNLIPETWGINHEAIHEKISLNLFTEEWANSCVKNFRSIIQTQIINKL